MNGHRFRESRAKRAAYGLSLVWLVLIALGILVPWLYIPAAIAGFAAGLWMGRLAEARHTAQGNGLVLGE